MNWSINSAIGSVKYTSIKPAIAINIEEINNNNNACFNLSKLKSKATSNLFFKFKSFWLGKFLKNLQIKLNRTNPEAQAKMQEENSNIPWGIIKKAVLRKSPVFAIKYPTKKPLNAKINAEKQKIAPNINIKNTILILFKKILWNVNLITPDLTFFVNSSTTGFKNSYK